MEDIGSLSNMNKNNQDSIMNIDTMSLLRVSCKCQIRRNLGGKRRMRLLNEFLQRETAPTQANAEEEEQEEEVLSQELEIEVQNLTLSYDLLFKIFILIPAESLLRLRFVCKKWFSLISSFIFITSHSHHSETVLICKKLTLSNPSFSDKPRISYFHVLDLNNGENKFIESNIVEPIEIRASYNGLILAITEDGNRLILMNLITRKHIAFPSGIEKGFLDESFGVALCTEMKAYKVVRLFSKKLASVGCEILNLSRRKWKIIEGPPSESPIDIRKNPISVGESLYWMPSKQGCDYFISMNVHDEKFISKKLPVNNCFKDQLVAIGGSLGFFSYEHEFDLLHVWILVNDGGLVRDWVKKYSVDLSIFIVFPSTICCSRNGKGLVVEMKTELYVYEFETGEMKLIQSRLDGEEWFGRIFHEYIPHQNTLAWSEDHVGS